MKRRLAALRASGMLSESEFEHAKAIVLDGGGRDLQMGQLMAQPALSLPGAGTSLGTSPVPMILPMAVPVGVAQAV